MRTTFALIGSIALATALHAAPLPQAPPQSQPPAPQTPPAAAKPAEKPAPPAPPPPLEVYTYSPQGRRDPFLTLIGTGAEPVVGKRGDGPAGMMTAEISVRGVLQSKGALVAMITGPDAKTYVVHAGDKLADGTIKSVTPQGLIIIQEVNDPLSLVKQREITKLLRALEVAK
jgi:Tfp pilus assembly protein PilP